MCSSDLSGVPVVISDQCHFPEVASAGAGRIVPLEPHAIADALLEVLENPAVASSMGRVGSAMVRERYTWPRVAAAFTEAYEAVGPAKAFR